MMRRRSRSRTTRSSRRLCPRTSPRRCHTWPLPVPAPPLPTCQPDAAHVPARLARTSRRSCPSRSSSASSSSSSSSFSRRRAFPRRRPTWLAAAAAGAGEPVQSSSSSSSSSSSFSRRRSPSSSVANVLAGGGSGKEEHAVVVVALLLLVVLLLVDGERVRCLAAARQEQGKKDQRGRRPQRRVARIVQYVRAVGRSSAGRNDGGSFPRTEIQKNVGSPLIFLVMTQ